MVTASAHSFSGIPNFFEVVGRINSLSSNASYSVSISTVPEPSSVALAGVGAIVLVGAYLGRIRLAFQRVALILIGFRYPDAELRRSRFYFFSTRSTGDRRTCVRFAHWFHWADISLTRSGSCVARSFISVRSFARS